jgi:adenylate cyclase
VPVNEMLDMIAAENNAARALYTAQIVGTGLKAGMAFNEFWKDEGMEAGPLPALFLREVSSRLSRARTDIGLFLGSDFPISPVNLFAGDQMKLFLQVKETKKPQYGQDPQTGLYIAMYPDFASGAPCVTCHNEHQDSPKTDWVLNDMMGATTWLYPRQRVSVETAVAAVAAFRTAARGTYEDFLAKTQGYKDKRPTIGDKWPADGLFLPDADTFMKAVSERASGGTLSKILSLPGRANDGKT